MTTKQRETIANYFATTADRVRVTSGGAVYVGQTFIGYRSERGFWDRFVIRPIPVR